MAYLKKLPLRDMKLNQGALAPIKFNQDLHELNQDFMK
jgi:hypothetical protein